MNKSASLILIPTPLSDLEELHPSALQILHMACQNPQRYIIAVEEHKVARRKWIKWGLKRELIDQFVLYNEHNRETASKELFLAIQAKKVVLLMSDGGLPGFCDPGMLLVNLCHQADLTVSATSSCNSVSLALALSGYNSHQFTFYGNLPKQSRERQQFYQQIRKQKSLLVLMDTPYRLKKVLEEVEEQFGDCFNELCLATNLGHDNELVMRGKVSKIRKSLGEDLKREFILILNNSN